MRTLTLGVLIVSGGTFAALPFRRYHGIPDASATPVQVTGPTHSALDAAEPGSGVFNALATGESPGDAVAELEGLAAKLPSWSEAVAPQPPRRVDIPLSYEDLAQPIDPPVAIEERFNATSTVREKQLQRERVAGLVMPAMESLAVAQQQQLQQAADSLSAVGAQTPPASASLASTSSRDQHLERLPRAEPVERDRHWIRQPD